MKKLFLFFLIVIGYCHVFCQTLSNDEQQLYNLIMAYRAANNLPKIPVSKSLTFVAQAHVKDLVENKPDKEPCNSHSWSNKGSWKPCCYTSDHAQAAGMWNKPRELTKYKGNGYEIAAGSNNCCDGYKMTAEQALKGWQNSSGHNAVILNIGGWRTMPWQAIGIGIYEGFAVVWFGEEEDVTTQ